jgi:plastocyanin
MAIQPGMRTLITAILGLSMAACTVGTLGGGDDVSPPGDDTPPGDDDPAPTPRVAMTMTPPTLDSELGTMNNTFSVSVVGSDGFSGPVTLAVTGVPADWQAAFDTPTVDVPLNGSATATLTIVVPTDAVGATASLTVTGTSSTAAPASTPTPSTLNVLNQYSFHLPSGAGENPNAHGFPTQLRLKTGVTLRIVNDDGIKHQIHSDVEDIFPHEGDGETSQPGGIYEVLLETSGQNTFYCHDHSGPGTNLVVE